MSWTWEREIQFLLHNRLSSWELAMSIERFFISFSDEEQEKLPPTRCDLSWSFLSPEHRVKIIRNRWKSHLHNGIHSMFRYESKSRLVPGRESSENKKHLKRTFYCLSEKQPKTQKKSWAELRIRFWNTSVSWRLNIIWWAVKQVTRSLGKVIAAKAYRGLASSCRAWSAEAPWRGYSCRSCRGFLGPRGSRAAIEDSAGTRKRIFHQQTLECHLCRSRERFWKSFRTQMEIRHKFLLPPRWA